METDLGKGTINKWKIFIQLLYRIWINVCLNFFWLEVQRISNIYTVDICIVFLYSKFIHVFISFV